MKIIKYIWYLATQTYVCYLIIVPIFAYENYSTFLKYFLSISVILLAIGIILEVIKKDLEKKIKEGKDD